MSNQQTVEYYKQCLAKLKEKAKTLASNVVKAKSAYGVNSTKYKEAKKEEDKNNEAIASMNEKIASMEKSSASRDAPTNSMTGEIPSLTDIKTTVTDLAATLGKQAISDIASKANEAVKEAFKKVAEKMSSQSNLTTSKNDTGKQETDSKVAKLSSSENTAIAQPVAFVSKLVTDALKPTANLPQDSKQGDELLKSNPQLAKTAETMAAKDKTDGSWSSTISSITDNLSNAISSALPKVDMTSLNKQATSLLSGATNLPVVSDIADFVNSTAGNIVTAGKDLTKGIADLLPDSVGKVVTSFSDAALQQAVNVVSKSKLVTYANLATKLAGTIAEGDLWDTVSGLAAPAAGFILNNTDITSKLGNNSSDFVKALVGAAKETCPGVTDVSGMKSVQEERLKFDALVQTAAVSGMNQLLKDLLGCGQSSSGTQLSTSNTTNMLKSLLPAIAGKGDGITLETIVSGIGLQNVPNLGDLVVSAIGNTSTPNIKNPELKASYDRLTNLLDSDSNPLNNKTFMTTNTRGETTVSMDAYDAKNVSIASMNNTVMIDELIGKDNRAMVQAVLFSYS